MNDTYATIDELRDELCKRFGIDEDDDYIRSIIIISVSEAYYRGRRDYKNEETIKKHFKSGGVA